MKRIVMSSGGITSWATARWIADTYGTEDLVLLFADTLAEDEDLYRFNADVASDLGMPMTVVCDGRTPQQVGRDRKHLGNTQVANCSHLLKQLPARIWLTEHCDPAETTVYLGIDWSEMHRLPGQHAGHAHPLPGGCSKPRLCRSLFDRDGRLEGPGCGSLLEVPWRVEAPLTQPPYRDKADLIATLQDRGIAEPRLYALGFAHNNCGGACVKAGQAQWAHLLRVFPDRYASWEQHEQNMRADLDKDVAILRDRTGGTTRPLPLTVLRQRIEASTPGGFDALDWGGCGCFTDAAVTP